mgnify:CR=1 FL=1
MNSSALELALERALERGMYVNDSDRQVMRDKTIMYCELKVNTTCVSQTKAATDSKDKDQEILLCCQALTNIP